MPVIDCPGASFGNGGTNMNARTSSTTMARISRHAYGPMRRRQIGTVSTAAGPTVPETTSGSLDNARSTHASAAHAALIRS